MSISLDSDDDDGPPPGGPPVQQAAAHADPISLDSDEDEDLPPPRAAGGELEIADSLVVPPPAGAAAGGGGGDISLDSDDDLPPPMPPAMQAADSIVVPPAQPAAAKKAAPAQAAVAAPARPAAGGKQPAAGGGAASQAGGGARARAGTAVRHPKISDLKLEAFLGKQSPTWPYVMQKRWVVLSGRVLSYYEAQNSSNASGTIELKNAQIVGEPQNAKAAHCFGITAADGRTFIFAASSRDEWTQWLEALKVVTVDKNKNELHWFDKMAQGIF